MYVKDANGNMIDVASQNVGGWGLGLGITGTLLGLANHAGGYGLFGGNGMFGNTTRNGQYIGSEADEISKLRMDNAILNAEKDSDRKDVEIYTALNKKDNEFRDRLDAVKEDLSNKIAAEREARLLAQGEQAVINAKVDTGLALLKEQGKSMAATLAEITEMVIPQRRVVDTSCCACGM